MESFGIGPRSIAFLFRYYHYILRATPSAAGPLFCFLPENRYGIKVTKRCSREVGVATLKTGAEIHNYLSFLSNETQNFEILVGTARAKVTTTIMLVFVLFLQSLEHSSRIQS